MFKVLMKTIQFGEVDRNYEVPITHPFLCRVRFFREACAEHKRGVSVPLNTVLSTIAYEE